jgi:hypothetical protein
MTTPHTTMYLMQPSDYDEGPVVYPLPIDKSEDKQLWIINGYKIWARDYEQALELAVLIDSF